MKGVSEPTIKKWVSILERTGIRFGKNKMDEKKYEIKLIPEAVEDYKILDGSVKKDVNKKIDKLSQNPLCGLPLGNKDNEDLTGFYKLYAFKRNCKRMLKVVKKTKFQSINKWLFL